MPPRTRAVKVSKENANILTKNNVKPASKATKVTRKPFADKTNSASDENASPEPLQKVVKTNTKSSTKVVTKVIDEERPRRNRRLPTRYVENQVLNNLSNSKENAAISNKSANKTPVKEASKVNSPLKSPKNVVATNLLASRSRRASHLPSKFNEQFVSPIKASIQPCNTSTPLVQKQNQPKNIQRRSGNKQDVILEKVTPQKLTPQKVTSQKVKPSKEPVKKVSPKKVSPQKPKSIQKTLVKKKLSEVLKRKVDTNSNHSNVRQDRTRRLRKPVEYKEMTLSPKIISPGNEKPKNMEVKKKTALNSSFRVFEEKKTKDVDNQDVYEFTFDPSEEPLPQKKKRKKVTTKKPAKPKTRFFNNNYEKNIAKALADLKNVVSNQKPERSEATSKVTKPVISRATNREAQQVSAFSKPATVPNPLPVVISTTAEVHGSPGIGNSIQSNISTKNHASIRVEDIAADFEASMDRDDINYSPVHFPQQVEVEPRNVNPDRDTVRMDDPLNLRNDLSFFDDQPVASSSMNMSNRNPMSTPWRAEFESLPIKWQANTYVKPDMTPALESSYINNFDDSKKKHVYTNMVLEENEPLQEIVLNEAPKLKQTSIISFIKEVVEKSARKKQKGRPRTPKKANSLFDNTYTSVDANDNKTRTSVANESVETSNQNSCSENDTSADGKKTQKRKHVGDKTPTPAKVPRKENDNTLFGFDDSENQDQENVSPVNIVNTHRLRSLRSGAVLKEWNKPTGPMRAELPAAMKSKLAPSSDVVERIYDQIKSASDAPMLLEKQIDGQATNIDGIQNDEDSQSVHLFEDIELVHHLKPTRKSYGKAKKVTFVQNSSDSGDDDPAHNLSSDDDAGDLSFHLPEIKAKKATKKKKKNKKDILSKKEKAEVDEWAANFNSMCEDVEEFDLVVE